MAWMDVGVPVCGDTSALCAEWSNARYGPEGITTTVPVPAGKTEAALVEPGQEDGRTKRPATPGRPNVLKPGTVLQNRYRVLDVLGVGGMSTVYRARDLRFTSVERLCAIKEMFNSTEDPKLRQLRLSNFQREAALLATLTHSAIPRIYDYFEQQGTIYLVLELIHGLDLETLLSQRAEPFEEAAVIDWTLELSSVLEYLHGQEPEPVIFRDLKPSNIMIRDDGRLMLVDFGIARSFAPQQRGTMIGTEGYAPPEQYRGIADARGDLYALGATLHHLSTGSDPRSETPFTFAQRPPRRLNQRLTPEFEQIVLKMVQYSPADRYQTIHELKRAILELKNRPTWVASAVEAVEANKRNRANGSNLLSVPVWASDAAGRSPAAAPATQDNRLDWTLKTGDEVRSSASIAGGAVYIGSYDGNLYAVDETDGTVRWRFKTQRGIVSRPLPIAEMVIFGSEDRSVYAVSRQTGRSIWSYRTNMAVRSSALADDRSCYVGSDDGFLYRLDRTKGTVGWRYRTWGPIRSSAHADREQIIFGSDDGYLYCVQRETGQLNWRYNVGSPVMSSPLVAQGIVVVGASDGAVRGLSTTDGKLLWTYQTGKTVIASPVVVDQTVYIGSADGAVYALALDSGGVNWKSPLCRQLTATASTDGGWLYVGGVDGTLYCLNRDDGSVKWSVALGGPIVAKPLVTPDHIIVGSLDGTVYALHRST
ncbi:MAG: eukaryotic-like serine/threonine-protein kinase [Thermomicrobiales bacterium]|nr:eukaryotic-like serine/threonine-protein kinase [Thermomicrobiales bacterium]